MNKKFALCGASALALAAIAMAADPAGLTRTAGHAPIGHQARSFNVGSTPQSPRAIPEASAVAGLQTVFEMHPTKEEFDRCKVVDANNDGMTITYYYAESDGKVFDWPIFYTNDGTSHDADDWIFTPAIHMAEKENLYRISLDVRVGATFSTESFSVSIGTTPDPSAMTEVVMDEPFVSGTDFHNLSSTFGIQAEGDYYIGIHITSKKDRAFRLMMKDINVSYTDLSAAAPLPVENLKATPDPDGKLFATVEFDMPTLTVNGNKYGASEKLTAKISTATGTYTSEETAGSHVSKVIPMNSGENIVVVSVESEIGESSRSTTSVRCSIDIPADPVVTTVTSADNMSLTMTWDPVTTGVNGGIIKPEEVTYNVYIYHTSEDESGYASAGWLPLAVGLTECTYTFTATETQQSVYNLLVSSANSSGESNGSAQSAVSGYLGALYPLPMGEDYSNYKIEYSGYVVEYPDDSYNSEWGFGTASNQIAEAGSYGILGCVLNGMNVSLGQMAFPRFDTKNSRDMFVSLDAWIDETAAPTEVYIRDNKGQFERIGSFGPGTGGWTTFTFRVPETFNNSDWASLVLRVLNIDPSYALMLRSWNIRQLKQHDIAITSLTVDRCVIGQPTKVTAVVTNVGAEFMSLANASARIDFHGVDAGSFNIAVPNILIEQGESVKLTAEFTLDKADYIDRQLSFVCRVNGGGDENEENNTAVTRFTVQSGNKPVITDLTGKNDGDGITLEWSDPTDVQFVEGFEYLDHGDMGPQLGDWQNIDFDGKHVYSIEEVNFPSAVNPKAFQAIDCTQLTGAMFEPHSGNQCLVAFSAQEALSDDWLISPELDPADGFTFWTMIFNPEFPETIEVLVSSTDNEPDSFTLLERYVQNTYSWICRSVDLPADTRYVAIHYCSNDQFGIVIDDIAFTPVGRSYNVSGYNVYRNGERIADRITSRTYTDRASDYATNYYNVSVVATDSKGVELEHPKSNTVNLTFSGLEISDADAVEVIGGYGEIILRGFRKSAGEVAVYGINGSLIATPTANSEEIRLNVPSGIYIVEVCGRSWKIAVR